MIYMIQVYAFQEVVTTAKGNVEKPTNELLMFYQMVQVPCENARNIIHLQ